MTTTPTDRNVAIIGAGPAGLMAAETLALRGISVDLYDAMPSPGRKFLLAGVGGMNITHSEAFEPFLARYRERAADLRPILDAFTPEQLCEWIHGLGIATFIGSSGRVFPTDMKAAPLLRAWLKRLREAGVRLHTRHRWVGWAEDGRLCFDSPDGPLSVAPSATVLALGGGSWPRLGSDAGWMRHLTARGVGLAALEPANCGFEVAGWSDLLKERFAGAPLKNVMLTVAGQPPRKGEFILTEHGLEGSLIYALSAEIRDDITHNGRSRILLDLLPERTPEDLAKALGKPRGRQSMGKHIRRQTGLEGVKSALLHECLNASVFNDPKALAAGIKALPIELLRPRPLEEAISSAGGVPFEALDSGLMLRTLPGVFCAGEMLDWEAPTGGYLLTACFATGRAAALGLLRWLDA